MKLLGYTLRSPVVRQDETPDLQDETPDLQDETPDLQEELLEAVDRVNVLWSRARGKRMRLSLWVDWPARELIVHKLDARRVSRDLAGEKIVERIEPDGGLSG